MADCASCSLLLVDYVFLGAPAFKITGFSSRIPITKFGVFCRHLVDGIFWRIVVVWTRVLHGPGLRPRAGPARSPWTGPGQDSMIFCGPGRVRAWNLQARAGPGLVSNNFAGCGTGLGLTFPGLGRAGPIQ